MCDRPASSSPSAHGNATVCGAAAPRGNVAGSSGNDGGPPERPRSGTGRGQRVTFAELGGWSAILGALTSGDDLSTEAAAAAMREVLAGEATPAQIAGF